MRYTWDPEKDALNRRKHGMSLEEGVPALEDARNNSWIDDRFDYGKERFATLGLGRRRVLYVISTISQKDLTRVISVRKANKNEVEQYGRVRS
jgi:uncharacterized DUF497 family protein